jgi:putative transposase
VACRVLQVSRSGFYEWRSRGPSARDYDDARLLDTIIDVHAAARGTYGARRVHAELRLGRSLQVGRRRVERLMRCHHLAGVHRRRWRHAQRSEATRPDRVQRKFVADAPDRLWVTDITQHRTSEGWVYAAVVLDVFSRRVVGWSIADHLRTELVVDALQMAQWTRRPDGTIVHSDRGTQGEFNMESFWALLQTNVLDRRRWRTRAELEYATVYWIEHTYNRRRRQRGLGKLTPAEFELAFTNTPQAA